MFPSHNVVTWKQEVIFDILLREIALNETVRAFNSIGVFFFLCGALAPFKKYRRTAFE